MINKLICTALVAVVATLSMNANVLGAEKRVIIGFHKAPGSTERGMVERTLGRVKREFKHIKAITADIEESELVGLLNDPDVAYVEEDVMVKAIDPIAGTSETGVTMTTGSIEYDNAWSVLHIAADLAHSQSITGAGVNIAILDTGIDYNHPDLDMNYSGGDNFISLDVNNHDPLDDSYNSHGTHVAGVIAAELDGSGVVGVAPDASIYALKVLDGAGFGSVSSIVAGIDWAIENQMDIVNMSMGISTYSQLLADACAEADAAGILLVAAAGNNYGGPIIYPAAFPSVIAVGATTIFDEIAPINPVGPEMELVAPGLNVYSTVANGGYGFLGGTSQAAPHVSGLAALIMSAGVINDIDGDGVVNNNDVRILMQNSSIDLGVLGFDEIYGHGLVTATTLFSGSGSGSGSGDDEYPIIHLTLEKTKCSSKKSWQNMTIEDGIFDVTIVNTSLRGVKVLVFEEGHIRRDISVKYKFEENDPQEVSFSLDATGTAFKLAFIPKSKKNGLADAYIQKQ